ncbi:uracil-DNA glycosylase [Pseudooctadecabacter sp.]|uniref:uracil-DNA glycosylase n=1 Tax=Pseudooctadecabacter sp. TaxID=1966338 RepID=UPI0025FCBB34|nr:uracil-DNA glycosylase [Pseudooctadecabacter sp.]
MILPRPDLPGWADLPFWDTAFPAVQQALEADTRHILPPVDDVFRALALVAPDDCRVVILGQDPYHTRGKPDGLAFSIRDDFAGRLDSLGNIFKEIESDTGAQRTKTTLDDWAQQGVLLLNTALTVPEGAAKGHAKLGWNALTRDVLMRLGDRPRAFVLWGGHARGFAKHITAPPTGAHLIHESAHPSPLSVKAFRGTRPFSAVNDWLKAQGKPPIHWGDPERGS